MKSVRAVISGRVQGVWYRAWTENEATERGLSGWVRNCSNGRAVENPLKRGLQCHIDLFDGDVDAEILQ